MRKTTLIVLTLTLCILNSGCNSEPSTTEVNEPVTSSSEPNTTEMSSEDQFNLGEKYRKGEGVPQDYKEAMKWYLLAAEQGHAGAEHILGWGASLGSGVPENYYKEAVKWYRLAAEQGHAFAQRELGDMYYYGLGVTHDYTEAVKWIRMAAEQGDVEAAQTLGVMYSNGMPESNYTEAYIWYSIARAGGHRKIKMSEILELLKEKLSPEQLAEAQSRATELSKQIEERQQ
jgi:TPR repeat protein